MPEPDDMVLAILREKREDMRSVSHRLGRMEKRIDAMHRTGLKSLSFVGHRAMAERAFADVDQVNRLGTRVETPRARA